MQRRDFLLGGSALGLTGLCDLAAADTRSGYFVPPEDAPHQRTFMQWPVSRYVYPDPLFLKTTQQTIADIANAVCAFEPVTMLAARDDHAAAQAMLSSRVALWDVPTEDLWCRDSGPIFVVNTTGSLAISHIQFNGWGQKQVNRRDSQIASRVAERLGLRLLPTGLVGEAGGVEQDGHGLLIAHESSWVNDNRNPGLSRGRIGQRLLAAYGADRLIWSKGVQGEDITDYHIDGLARFTGAGRVLIALPDQPDLTDPFHAAAMDTHDALVAAGLQVETIPDPRAQRVRDITFVASYANYYVCNGGVIGPQFGDPDTDRIAVDALARHYPDREIVTLNVDVLGTLGGGIHCATQQMPAT